MLAEADRARPRRGPASVGRTLLCVALCCGVSLGLIGCFDLEWDWDTWKWYPKEPTTITKRRRVAPASTSEARRRPEAQRRETASSPDSHRRETASTSDAPRRSESKPPVRLGSTPASLSGFYRLHLVSGPGSATESVESAGQDMEMVQLAVAKASQVGRLLAELYPPLGPGGTEHRYYLVYQSPVAMRAAARLAVQLDVGTEGMATGADLEPLEAFRAAVPMYYELTRRGGGSSTLSDEVVARLDLAAGSDQVADRLRWAAAMMAVRIHADYHADAAAQSEALATARRVVPADSFEAFLAGAALQQWYDDNAMNDQAEDLAKELVVQFQQFGGTAPYERCMHVAQRGVD